MRKILTMTCAAAFCAATAGLAQTPSQTPSSSMSGKDKTITVSGCVARASDTGGTTGTTGTSGTAPKFELTNASIAGGSASTSGSPSEATGTSGTSAAAKTYQLDATDTQLAAHLNHKVEITGTIDESASSGASSETAGTTGSSKAAAPKLKVESVKMVSATCQ